MINCKKIAAISSVFGIPKTEVKENFTFIFIQNIFRLIIFSNLKKKKRMSLCHKDFVFQRLTISNIICISNFDMGQLNFWTSKLNLYSSVIHCNPWNYSQGAFDFNSGFIASLSVLIIGWGSEKIMTNRIWSLCVHINHFNELNHWIESGRCTPLYRFSPQCHCFFFICFLALSDCQIQLKMNLLLKDTIWKWYKNISP